MIETLLAITPAYAQSAAPAAGANDLLMNLMPLILVAIIFYFLLLRPQQKRAREHQELIKNVRRGDVVVTSGGFVAKVTKVIDDNEVEVELADNVRVRLVRAMIADVRAKTEPVKGEGA